MTSGHSVKTKCVDRSGYVKPAHQYGRVLVRGEYKGHLTCIQLMVSCVEMECWNETFICDKGSSYVAQPWL